MHYINLGTKSD